MANKRIKIRFNLPLINYFLYINLRVFPFININYGEIVTVKIGE